MFPYRLNINLYIQLDGLQNTEGTKSTQAAPVEHGR